MVKSLVCLTCGADLKFNPVLQSWKCEWCDSVFEQEELEQTRQSSPAEPEIGVLETASSADIRTYTCSYCGAEVITDTVTAATFCLYCQRPVLMENRLSGLYKPEVLIPFKNTKEQAQEAFRNYLKGKRFLPDEYRDDQNIEKLTGVYIPFWLYGGTVGFCVEGEADIVTDTSDDDYDIETTDIYEIAREGRIRIGSIPVDASSRTPDDVMDSIEPFDFSQLIEFSMNYLSGFLAEKYDEDQDELYKRAEIRFKGSAENRIRGSLRKYSSVRRRTDDKWVDDVTARYGLLPVWILFSKFKDKQYIFAMNGQTGKLIGDLPIDNFKAAKFFLAVFALSALLGGIVSAVVQSL